MRFMVTFLLISFLGSCKLKGKADEKFGDQHFKTAIALIELHKTRFGEYPLHLDSLKFVGDWDQLAIPSVKYEKLDSGYALYLTRGWVGIPKDLKYPPAFWKGLGLNKSNLK